MKLIDNLIEINQNEYEIKVEPLFFNEIEYILLREYGQQMKFLKRWNLGDRMDGRVFIILGTIYFLISASLMKFE